MNTITRPGRPPWCPVSSEQGAADRDNPGHVRLITLPSANSFDGRDHVMPAAAFELHITAIANSAARDHPGFIPDESLCTLTGKDLHSPGADPASLAEELCTAEMWERADGGYRILDVRAVQACMDHVRELREKDKRAPAREPGHHAATNSPRPERRGRPAGEAAVTGRTRLGERIGQAAAASFRCAACGEMAAVVKVTRAGTTVDMGPPLGRQAYDRDAIIVDYFLGTAGPVSSPMPQPRFTTAGA